MQRHMIGRLLETDQLRSEFDFHARIRRGMRAQGGLDRRLREHHARRVPKRIRLGHHVDSAYQLALGAKMLGGGKRRDKGQHALGGAEVIQQAQDLMVDRDRTRLVVDIALTINGQRSNTLVPEQAGRDDP